MPSIRSSTILRHAETFLLCLLLLAVLSPGTARGESYTGTVLSLGDTGFVLSVVQGPEASRGKELTVQPLPRNRNDNGDASSLPACVRVGRTVTVIGRPDPESGNIVADLIRGEGWGRRHDPTGVRTRLRRCRRFQGRTAP